MRLLCPSIAISHTTKRRQCRSRRLSVGMRFKSAETKVSRELRSTTAQWYSRSLANGCIKGREDAARMRAEMMEKKLQESKGRGLSKLSQFEIELKEKKMRELEKAEREGDKNGFSALRVRKGILDMTNLCLFFFLVVMREDFWRALGVQILSFFH